MALPDTETPEVQVQVPAGMTTVSPLADALMAFCTSAELQVAAVRVVACAALANKRRIALENQSCFFMIDALPFQRAHTRGTQCPLHIA